MGSGEEYAWGGGGDDLLGSSALQPLLVHMQLIQPSFPPGGREALVPVTGEGMLWTLSLGTGQLGAGLGGVSSQGMAGLLRPF